MEESAKVSERATGRWTRPEMFGEGQREPNKVRYCSRGQRDRGKVEDGLERAEDVSTGPKRAT